MKKKTVISPDDYMYMEQNPEGDADFNEERNRMVIAETIKKIPRPFEKKRRISLLRSVILPKRGIRKAFYEGKTLPVFRHERASH